MHRCATFDSFTITKAKYRIRTGNQVVETGKRIIDNDFMLANVLQCDETYCDAKTAKQKYLFIYKDEMPQPVLKENLKFKNLGRTI